MNYPALTKRQHATILAALRSYQCDLQQGHGSFSEIATNAGEFEPLTVEQIDILCARIN